MVGGDAGLLRRRRVWSLLLISGGRAQKKKGRPARPSPGEREPAIRLTPDPCPLTPLYPLFSSVLIGPVVERCRSHVPRL
jgi:hypothetical protein